MMDDSSLSAGDHSLNVSDVLSEERFCAGEEQVASCVSYINQVRVHSYTPTVPLRLSSAGAASVGAAVSCEERYAA